LEKLRADRLEREREDRRETEQLLARLRGDNSDVVDSTSTSTSNKRRVNRDDYEEEDVGSVERPPRGVKQMLNLILKLLAKILNSSDY